ncbi:hypothetical protein A5711_24870 [Mycobacterium sp. E2238]|nr:hypothetical protein A5711_24870 [Mycobacterium sp. E2238]
MLGMGRTFDDLVAEADAAPVDGWDFSWLDGRATEERPSWGYQRQMSQRLASVSAACDIDTGVGDGQFVQPRLIHLDQAGARFGVLCAPVARGRPAVLRRRQRGLVRAWPGKGLLVGGLQAVVEVGQLRIAAHQLLRRVGRFGAVECRRGRRGSGGGCFGGGAGRRRGRFRTAGAQHQGRNDDGEQSHTC